MKRSARPEPGAPLDGLGIALVGPGRVGTSLVRWAAAAGARLVAVAGRAGSGHAEALARELGGEALELDRLGSSRADLLLVAVPDAAIDTIAVELARGTRIPVALHTAGALGASALAPLAAAGVATGTLHPLRAFPEPSGDPDGGHGVFFAIDGDPRARALAERVARALGGEAAEVPEPARLLYHFAATLAAGGVATLLAAAFAQAERAGLPAAVRRGYGELARGALAAALAAPDPADAITGPAARGDRETFARQLAALAQADPATATLAVALAREALRQRARRGPLSPDQRALADWLANPELLDRPRDRMLTSPEKP